MTSRVVSLLPAATEIVWALGAGDRLVGVSHECDYPEGVRGIPRVTRTSLKTAGSSAEIDAAVAQAVRVGAPAITVDRSLLRALRPDVVIGQAVCDVCAVGTAEISEAMRDVEEQRRGEASRDGGSDAPTVITLHAHTLSGVFDDIRRVGAALDLIDRANELIAGLQSRLERLSLPNRTRPRVLVLEWLDPPYVAGHWVPELVAAAGGEDVAARPGTKSVPRPWQELRALAPDLVVVAPCGFDVPRAQRELAAVTDPDAVALLTRRIRFVDGNAYTSRPGPRLVDAAEQLSKEIHDGER